MTEKNETREQLLEVAHQTFTKFGFKKTTLDDIALRFGKGKTAIYYYFNSREAIFKAVLDKEINHAVHSIRNSVTSASTDAEKIKAYVETRMMIAAQTPVLNDAGNEAKLKHNDLIEETAQRFANEKVNILANILKEGIEAGTFKIEEPHIAALAIETALKGLDSDNLKIGYDPQRSEKLLKLLFYGILQ